MTRTVRVLLSLLACASLVGATHSAAVPRVCDVTEYGAVGDGRTYDTVGIQEAIDACAASGGGTVVFPTGRKFLTATLFVKSHVELRIESGAVVLGGDQREDYPKERDRWYVILAEDATDVAITGGGTIDGQALNYVLERNPHKYVMREWTGPDCTGECRPRLVGFVRSRRIRVSDVHLVQPAYWCLHFVASSDIDVSRVTIFGDFNIPNNDGIDIDSSARVRISECDIDTGDDGICPKTSTAPTEDVHVSRCRIRSKSGAIKFGSASVYDFRRLRFEDIVIAGSHRGLGFQLRDNGSAYDIAFENIRVETRLYDPSWWGRAEPIYLSVFPRNNATAVGAIERVSFRNISCASENGAFISGGLLGDRANVRDILLENVHVTLAQHSPYAVCQHDYRPSDIAGLVDHATSALFIESAEGIAVVDSSFGMDLAARSACWGAPYDTRAGSVRDVVLDHTTFNG